MNIINKSILASLAILAIGCQKDNNEYNYNDAEQIIVEGVQKDYTVIADRDTLKINAKAISNLPDANIEYTWGVYETNVQGYAPKLDTIAKGNSLVYPIKLNAKTWKLVLIAKNTKSGYANISESTLNVTTPYTKGWYVAKSIGDSTDIDQFIPGASINNVEANYNVFSRVNGHKLAGSAKQLTFLSSYKTDVITPASFANTRTFFLQSNKEIAAVYINNFKKYRGQNELFFGGVAPEGNVAATFYGSSAYYIVKGQKLYCIYNMIANTGLFSASKMINAQNDEYKLADYYMVSSSSNPFFFDEISSSFISMSMGYGTTMTKVVDATTNTFKANNNNQNLIYMGYRSQSGSNVSGVAVFKDKTDPTVKTLALLSTSSFTMTTNSRPIESSSKLYNAHLYATIKADESMMYFANNNKIYSYNLDNAFENLQFDTPAGEEVTFIKHEKYTGTTDLTAQHNYVIIGTNKGDKYKIRFFKKTSGNLEATPDFTIEGNGTAKDIIYLAPVISETTYPSTL